VRPEGGVTGARPLQRPDLIPHPVIDGREARDHSLARLRRRMGSLLVSGAERDEVELERRLRALPGVTRPNVVAVVSPKGGVGKTTSAFVAGNLLASHLKLRAIAVDATPGFGTLGRLAAGSVESPLTELLANADRLGTAAELRRYVARHPSGLHLLASSHDMTHQRSLGPDTYGELIALLSCFYETVLIDLASGVTSPLARLALDRADQMVLVTTPEQLTATLAIHALDQLDRERTTVVVNRTHPRMAPELRAIEECLARRDAPPPVTLPDDRRLAMMLDSGTYTLEALDRRTRLPVKRLGLAVAERLV
jgi:MinD-like ATPase involved in chromosome partitioning or flagellar assembly